MAKQKGSGRRWSNKPAPGNFTTTAVVATSQHAVRKTKKPPKQA